MNFKVGDKVRFLNDVGEGKVIKLLSSDEVVVEDESGFEYPYPSSELILIDGEAIAKEREAYDTKEPKFGEILARNVNQDILKRAETDFNAKTYNEQRQTHRKKGEVMEVDLHMHEIMDNLRGLNPSEMLSIQMEHFERMMKRAEQNRVNCVIFIHGVGEGVLRNEIRKAIQEYYPNCEAHDASYQEYGYGATEVVIRRG